MKKRYCSNCGKSAWGLIRYYLGFRQFCSRKCLSEYEQKQLQEVDRRRQFLHWLNS